jgi:hypothetical protein
MASLALPTLRLRFPWSMGPIMAPKTLCLLRPAATERSEVRRSALLELVAAVQIMRQFRHIQTRPSAFALGPMILFLALAPSGSVAQTNKSEAKAQTQPALTAASIEGCYELKLGRWWPWGFGEENAYVTPPRRVRLLPERGTEGFEKYDFLIRALPRQKGEAPGRGGPSYWEVVSNNRIDLIWTDGFTGVKLELQKYGDELRGRAHPHFDAPHLIPRTASVTARRIACPAQ